MSHAQRDRLADLRAALDAALEEFERIVYLWNAMDAIQVRGQGEWR